MILFCFGIKPTQVKLDLIVQLCKSQNIELRHLNQNGDEENLTPEIDDKYQEYRLKYIIKTDNKNDCIQWADLREHFRLWHDQKFPDSKLQTRPDHIKIYFTKKIGKYEDTTVANDKRLKGFRHHILKVE